ncbi:exopolysaccharide Pel transporter PelG [Psychrobacillus lasiicapitis]|uniref:Uncharacterized protein n=1 Tax=Psychrobacillus lasiicapitis TaxID=1636719 RepID=A0A544T342_9BACI|nr:exopolysaccharide Pel transporter PelG [Psychrobacillus lasiicapitis]TQR11855.1 hypothetical protein FG382_14685 [Psychrobacillus lasiicapitis]GGA19991.1 hypothetical protein GCM10011384_06680 [Psychrobacillus lasiicapitis]
MKNYDPAIRESAKFNELLNEVMGAQSHPQDSFEIAALLESMGWNDDRVSVEFGIYEVHEIFDLSDQMWDEIKSKIGYQTFSDTEKRNTSILIISLIRSFLRGLIFAFPMAISIFAMLSLKFSLWSYQYLSLEQATSIAIGTILSFVLVGGFTQAIARRGYFYIIQGYYDLARRTTFLLIGIGFVTCFILSILMVVLNFIFNMFSYNMLFLIVLYFFFLTAIWLSVTVMYILKKEIVFTGLIIFGIFLVYVLFKLVGIDIIISQLISLCIVSVCSLFLVLFFFKVGERKNNNEVAKLPRFSITLYTVWPYFFYGFLYFSFLFIDRIIAWSKNEEFMPYLIWFRGQYELGLDFALLTIIIPMGVVEVVVNRLMFDLESSQKKYLAAESHKLYEKFIKMYKRMTVFILISTVVSSFVIYRVIIWYNDMSIRLNNENILESEVTVFVLFWGIVSYSILAFCLMNVVILFALSQPARVIKAFIPALLTNIVVGFLLSRWFDYHFAVIGLFVGSLLLFYLTIKAVIDVLQNLDYYLYAAS